MRQFRHLKAIAFVLCVCLLMGLVPGSRFTAAARAAEPIVTVEKTIAGFGTSALSNPERADGTDFWRGDYVYFGTSEGKPIRFRVLSTSTSDFGGNTMLLESEDVLAFGKPFSSYGAASGNVWQNSVLRTHLNGTFLQESFTSGEQGVIASSTKAAMTGSDDKTGMTKYYEFAPLSNDKVFVLDVAEIANTQYGYMAGMGAMNGEVYPRQRPNLSRYWLRSANNNGATNTVIAEYQTRALSSQYPYLGGTGACPVLNIHPASILFLSRVEEAGTYSHAAYKLTLKDSGKSISVPSGQAITYTPDGVVTVPYTYSDNAADAAQKVNRISVLITQQALTGSNNPTVLYYGALADIRDEQGNTSTVASAKTGSGTFTLPANLMSKTLGTDYHLYILPEHVNATTRQNRSYLHEKLPGGDAGTKEMVVSCATDYAGSPVEITAMRPAHTHSFAYAQSGSEIRAWCANTQQAEACSYQQSASALRLVLTAKNMTYSGSVYSSATYTNSISAVTGAQPGKLTYQGTGSTSYAQSVNPPTEAGTYQASVTLGGKTAAASFTIEKAASTCTPPVGLQPVYTGSALALVSAGQAFGGTMQYSLDKQTWSTSVPTAIEAGDYTVYYRVTGDGNHTGLSAASVTAKIKKMTQTGISASDTEVDYDGKPHGITVSMADSTGVTVRYGASADACNQASLTYVNAGVYTIYYKAVRANAEDYTGSATLTIHPIALTVKADDSQKVYGESDPAAFSYSITQGALVEQEQLTGITVTRETGETVRTGGYTITPSQPDGANPNYKIDFQNGTFSVLPKVIDIEWGSTALTYNGLAQFPQVTAQGAVKGDSIALSVDGAQSEAGEGYTATVTGITGDHASCYALPESGLTTAFSIRKADQNAPTGIQPVHETIAGRHDGMLTGLAVGMEYRRADEGAYTAVTGTEVAGLAPGQYVVRYAAAGNYNASADCPAVEIRQGRQLTVTLPQTMTGYTLTADPTLLDWHGQTTLTFALRDGYATTGSFSITDKNGNAVTQADGKYVLSNAEKDVVIVVNGVADIAAPVVEIRVQENRWDAFLSAITFNLFFRQTQTVTLTVPDADQGSGLQSLHYHIADHGLSLSEVQALPAADWTPYTAPFVMEKERTYVIYARAVDQAGNTAYVSSDGMIIDKTAPEIADLKDGMKYYGEVTFTAGDSYLRRVEIDGTEAAPDMNGLYRILPDNCQHTVAVEDEAGNRTQIAIWVYRIYTVKYVVDGETVSTQQVGCGQNAIPPEIPTKPSFDEMPPKWNHDGTNITADTTITAIYTKNEPGEISDTTDKSQNYGQAVLGDNVEALKAAVPFSSEEQALILLGKDISLWIEVEDISGTVSEEDRARVASVLEDSCVGLYLDISMFKQVADQDRVAITKLNAPVTIILTLPEQLMNTRGDVIRSFQVVRVHDGITDILETVQQGNTLSFQTDRFSTYALIYHDSIVNLPQTGDNSTPELWFALLAVSSALLLLLFFKKNHRTQKN